MTIETYQCPQCSAPLIWKNGELVCESCGASYKEEDMRALSEAMQENAGQSSLDWNKCRNAQTFTAQEEGAALWSHVLEIVYSITGIGSGVCMIAFTKAQGASYMTSDAAKCVLLPLFWSALHLLVNYRMTCTDPRLPLFAFGLLADVMLVLAFYHIARLLYGRPQPMLLALFGALAAVMSFSDLGGYGLARLMGVTSVAWPAKMLLRSGLSAAACIYVLAQLFVLCSRNADHAE